MFYWILFCRSFVEYFLLNIFVRNIFWSIIFTSIIYLSNIYFRSSNFFFMIFVLKELSSIYFFFQKLLNSFNLFRWPVVLSNSICRFFLMNIYFIEGFMFLSDSFWPPFFCVNFVWQKVFVEYTFLTFSLSNISYWYHPEKII